MRYRRERPSGISVWVCARQQRVFLRMQDRSQSPQRGSRNGDPEARDDAAVRRKIPQRKKQLPQLSTRSISRIRKRGKHRFVLFRSRYLCGRSFTLEPDKEKCIRQTGGFKLRQLHKPPGYTRRHGKHWACNFDGTL